jgi:hypothetical protein
MSSRTRRALVGAVLLALAPVAWFAVPVVAQNRASAGRPREIDSDPIKCWWKTDRSAVHVGERFTLVLTCGVIETSRIRVVADPNRFDPMAMELTPFEVLGGARHRDIEAPPWRYFQYTYTLRLIGDDFFGQDVDIPSIQITYTIRPVGGDGAPGREQLYVLPPLPVRIQSLVPAAATDIRDAAPETFADIEARQFRATGELAAAGILIAFSVVLVALGIVGRYRRRAPAVVRPLPLAAVLRGSVHEARDVKSEVERAGWTPELIARALTLFRIAGAVALGRPVAQMVVDRKVRPREGQIVLRQGRLASKRALISASTTSAAVAQRLAQDNAPPAPVRLKPDPTGETRTADLGSVRLQPDRDSRTQAILEDIQSSLLVFGAACYGRNGHGDASALDSALEEGTRALERLHVTNQWPNRAVDRVKKAAARMGDMVWSR